MSKPIKEVILSTIADGPKILNELAVAKRIGSDMEQRRFETARKVRDYHPKYLHLQVIAKDQLNELACRLRLAPQEGEGTLPVFEAGQYINIFVDLKGCLTSRPYSLSNPPHERAYFEIIVARKKDGFVSDYILNDVQVGDCFITSGPLGVFRYQPTHHEAHQVMIAGGSGITPMQSMILEELLTGGKRKLTLFYGVRRLEWATNHELFVDLEKQYSNFRYVPVLSEEEHPTYDKGFVDRHCIQKYVPDVQLASFFICGPEVMNAFCHQELEALRIRRGQIRRELFQARADIHNDPTWPENLDPERTFTLKVGEHRMTVKAGQTLLSALEKARLPVHVGCRSGECSYCRMKLVSGQVFVAPGCLLRHADEVFQLIHTCKSYPMSDVELRF